MNTAGILDKEPLMNMSYEDVYKSININYLGAVIVAKESYPYLQDSKGALLLFTSSSYTRGVRCIVCTHLLRLRLLTLYKH